VVGLAGVAATLSGEEDGADGAAWSDEELDVGEAPW